MIGSIRTDYGPKKNEQINSEIEAGGGVITVVTDEQRQVFEDLVSDYCYDTYREEVGGELWDRVNTWLEEYRAAN